MGRFTGLLGLIAILAVAWLCSSRKREIKFQLIAWGLGLQFAFALLVLKTDFGKLFHAMNVKPASPLSGGEHRCGANITCRHDSSPCIVRAVFSALSEG